MLPLALVVVILGGTGSLLGSFVGSIIVGFIYNFGQALLPELAYFVLFLPMLLVLMLAAAGPVRQARAMSDAARASPSPWPSSRWSPCRYWMPRHLLHQRGEPDPVLRHLRARPEHPGRLRRARLARSRRAVRHRRLRHRPTCSRCGLRPHRGDPRRAGRQPGLHRGLRRAGAARDRHRLHHDHAGARPDHLGPRLSLDQPHRRRQRHQRANPAGAVRLRSRRRRARSTTRRWSSS